MKEIILIALLAIVCGVLPIAYSMPPSPGLPRESIDSVKNDNPSDHDGDEVGEVKFRIRDRSIFPIDYLLYTRENPLTPESIKPEDLGARFISGSEHKGTIFLIHGFTSSGYAKWVQYMKHELLLVDNFNIIAVDWKEGANAHIWIYYRDAAANTRIVGKRTAELIQAIGNHKNVLPDQMHIIGHSLGAHCAGFTGKRIYEMTLGQRLGRISGLDPAGPLFAKNRAYERLDKIDAIFVDILHTNDGNIFGSAYGWKKNSPLGHADFYPNGGTYQPGCPWFQPTACHHGRAPDLYLYSIRTCPYLTRPGAAVCPEGENSDVRMGYHSYTVTGEPPATYCLKTTGTAPYCSDPIVPVGPTVFHATPFDPEDAADRLRHAVTGLGTDEAAILDVVTQHSNQQRLLIAEQYRKTYDRDLRREDLNADLSGYFAHTVFSLLDPPRVFDAREMRRAMEGRGTNEDILIEILSSRNNAEIIEIKKQYKALYNRDLDNDIRGDTSGNFRTLMLSLSAANRDAGPANKDQAREDARALREAGDGQWGTDEAVFTRILSTRSFAQLKEIARVYKPLAGRTLEESIRRETSGTLEDGYLAIVKLATNTAKFFAERLYHTMHGGGTRELDLIRLVVSRSEIDMKFIKEEFKRMYDETLADAIKGDTSFRFEDILLALIGES